METAVRFRHLPLAIVAVTAGLAVLGAVFAFSIIRTGAPSGPPLSAGPFGVAQDIPTSFGALGVEHVAKTKGLTRKSLSSANHGIGDLVEEGKTQVSVDVNITNLLQDTIRYSPTAFTLHVGRQDAKAILPSTASIRPGVLQPSASIDGHIAFVAKASRKKLWLRFDDPDRAQPVFVDLGRNAQGQKTPQSAFDRFFHHSH